MMSNKLYMMMKTKWLFPYRFRLVGWLVFVFAFVHGLPFLFMFSEESVWLESVRSTISRSSVYRYEYTDEGVAIGLIVGLLLIAFSREKVEDEMISRLRLEALQWSVYVNYLILAVAIVTVYDTAFFNVMIYNMFTVLVVFIARFRWLLHRHTHSLLAL